MKKLPGQQSTSQLGKFKDEAMDAGKSILTNTMKAAGSEPKKILESILGKAPSKDTGDQGIEDLAGGGSQTNDPQIQQKQRMEKLIEQRQKDQEAVRQHRMQLQEEIQYYEKKKREEEMEEEQEDLKEEQEDKQIEQVKREKRKEQMVRQTAGNMGSKEQGKGNKF